MLLIIFVMFNLFVETVGETGGVDLEKEWDRQVEIRNKLDPWMGK